MFQTNQHKNLQNTEIFQNTNDVFKAAPVYKVALKPMLMNHLQSSSVAGLLK